jgi:hypothetical protein
VARHDPARDVLDDHRTLRASADQIAGHTPLPGGRRDHPVGVPRRRLLLAGTAGAAAAAVIAAGGLGAFSGASTPAAVLAATPVLLSFRTGGAIVTASQELLKVAASAGRQPDTTGTGRYQYVKTQGWYLNTAVSDKAARSAVVPETRQLWTAPDGSGRLITQPGKPYFPSARSRRAWEENGGPAAVPAPSDETLGPGGSHLMWQPDSLSGDPVRLREQLDVGHPAELGPAETLVAVGDLYLEQSVQPAVRAAILRIIAGLPGLRYDGTTTDRAGRSGIGVSIDSDLSGLPTRYVMIFDPLTGQLLDSEEILTTTAGKLDVPIPSVVAYTVYLSSGRTDSLHRTR